MTTTRTERPWGVGDDTHRSTGCGIRLMWTTFRRRPSERPEREPWLPPPCPMQCEACSCWAGHTPHVPAEVLARNSFFCHHITVTLTGRAHLEHRSHRAVVSELQLDGHRVRRRDDKDIRVGTQSLQTETRLLQGSDGWPHPPWPSVSSFVEQTNQLNDVQKAAFYGFMEWETVSILWTSTKWCKIPKQNSWMAGSYAQSRCKSLYSISKSGILSVGHYNINL